MDRAKLLTARTYQNVTPRSGTTERHDATVGDVWPSHIVVFWITADVANEQHDGLITEVLPPMGSTVCFGPDFAGLVHDWGSAVAGVFLDLAFSHID